ncbi:molybdenum ABC transporter ATP-binding protein [Pseudoponticoccus marisrubri]|uniref:Molybdenum ABC transporter ATP-binding protein n=1 Tax=Pseudoponticoccus marisrubri TaxID=1685382 RepID=A0A0W7WJ72_9RHOB|nr:molybdenum ABC transporter ATP-binding protein [Pseudoponticoccus marisrubri]KUF10577.1 molybdenum ABC transporter ATP-binding protein [Pseudoponticoccus marisrubri]
MSGAQDRGLDVALDHRLGDFHLQAEFSATEGLTVLFGRSGSGKTTLVNAVAGLLRPQSGRIAVDGTVLVDTARGIWRPPHRRRVGYVFQDARLFPHLTVRQNLLYGRRFAPCEGAPRLDDVVGMLGIGALLSRRPAALSGGEKQRVAIGRALLANPALILADEPLAALDEPRKAEILPYFERLREVTRTPILYVSHAPGEVARLASTVVVLEAGRVIRCGPAAEVLSDPAVTPAGIRGVGAVLQARIRTHHEDGLTELEAGGQRLFLPRVAQAPGTLVRVRVAAQDVILSREAPRGLSALNILPGRIDAVRAGEGPGALVTLDTAAGRILARVTRRSAEALGLAPGTPCHAVIKTVSIAREDVGAAAPRQSS